MDIYSGWNIGNFCFSWLPSQSCCCNKEVCPTGFGRSFIYTLLKYFKEKKRYLGYLMYSQTKFDGESNAAWNHHIGKCNFHEVLMIYQNRIFHLKPVSILCSPWSSVKIDRSKVSWFVVPAAKYWKPELPWTQQQGGVFKIVLHLQLQWSCRFAKNIMQCSVCCDEGRPSIQWDLHIHSEQ